MTWQASYRTGAWTAVAGRRAWLLSDLPVDAAATAACWALAAEDVDAIDLLGALTSAGLRTLPNFCLIGLVGDDLVAFRRGGARLTVGDTSFEPASAVTWVEHRIEAPCRPVVLVAGDQAAAGAPLPLAAGVVQASALHLDPTAASPTSASVMPPPTVLAGHGSKRPFAPTTALDAKASPVGAEELTPPQAPVEPARGATLSARDLDDFDDDDGFDDDGVEGAAVPPAPQVQAAPVASGGAPYQDLFGVTVHRSVEDAAIREQDAEDEPTVVTGHDRGTDDRPVRAEPTWQQAPVDRPVQAPVVPVAAPPTNGASVAGMIDHVPGAGGGSLVAFRAPSVEPIPTGVVPAAADQMEDPAPAEVGLTVDRSTQAAMIAEAASSPAVLGPLVQAVRCERGHANPAHAARCRACDAPVAEQQPTTIPRPALGVLRLSTGDVIPLDRPVVMGRGPHAGHLVGGEHPNVVRLPSPEQDISRTHLEVRLDGWHVSVTDLESTNGTVVALEGRPPERLRPKQPSTIEPGTTVTLADEVSFRFEVAP